MHQPLRVHVLLASALLEHSPPHVHVRDHLPTRKFRSTTDDQRAGCLQGITGRMARVAFHKVILASGTKSKQTLWENGGLGFRISGAKIQGGLDAHPPATTSGSWSPSATEPWNQASDHQAPQLGQVV